MTRLIEDLGAFVGLVIVNGGLFLLLWLLATSALACLVLTYRRRALRQVVADEVDRAIAERLGELVPGQRDGGHDGAPAVVLPVQRDGD